MRLSAFFTSLVILLCPICARAETHQATIGLHDGELGWKYLHVDLKRWRGSDLLNAVNASLGTAGHIEIDQNKLTLRFDPSRLPYTRRQAKKSIRLFTEEIEPQAYAQQRRTWGLLMPKDVHPDRRMVILVHGLDCNRSNWQPMAKLLEQAGYQVAYFSYPSDGPVAGSIALMTDQMHALQETFPRMRLSIITHSMGGLVGARLRGRPALRGQRR